MITVFNIGDILTLEEFPFKVGGWSSYKKSSKDYEKYWRNMYKLEIVYQFECFEERLGNHYKTFLRIVEVRK